MNIVPSARDQERHERNNQQQQKEHADSSVEALNIRVRRILRERDR